jgi:hypothetical protein
MTREQVKVHFWSHFNVPCFFFQILIDNKRSYSIAVELSFLYGLCGCDCNYFLKCIFIKIY